MKEMQTKQSYNFSLSSSSSSSSKRKKCKQTSKQTFSEDRLRKWKQRKFFEASLITYKRDGY